VVTYAQVAALLGRPRAARAVGQAMAALGGDRPEGAGEVTEVPWHRVVNAQGGISPRPRVAGMLTQRLRLQGEGVPVRRGRVDLGRYRWDGPAGRPRRRPAAAGRAPRPWDLWRGRPAGHRPGAGRAAAPIEARFDEEE
jgi:methylated-DNA-protein-cysteine methyltransferase-like protein